MNTTLEIAQHRTRERNEKRREQAIAKKGYEGKLEELLAHVDGTKDPQGLIKGLLYISREKILSIDKINTAAARGVLYMDRSYGICSNITEMPNRKTRLKIIPTGVTINATGEEAHVSFYFDTRQHKWIGTYIGTVKQLIHRALRYGNLTELPTEVNECCIPCQLRDFNSFFYVTGYDVAYMLKLAADKQAIKQTMGHSNSVLKGSSSKITEQIGPDILNAYFRIPKPSQKPQTRNTYFPRGVISNRSEVPRTQQPTHHNNLPSVSDVLDSIYNRLLTKENWRAGSVDRLKMHLIYSFDIVYNNAGHLRGTRGNGFLMSTDRQRVVVNTGLIDCYGNSIYLLDNTFSERGFMQKKLEIDKSKVGLVQYGFAYEDVQELPGPMKLYKDKGDLIFDGTLESVDIENLQRLEHILEERRHRFPVRLENYSLDTLCRRVKDAVSSAIQMQARDFTYIVPYYNIRKNELNYMLPFHINNSLEQPPELVIVLQKYGKFYMIGTILDVEAAYGNARLLCTPSPRWLRIT